MELKFEKMPSGNPGPFLTQQKKVMTFKLRKEIF
jgi:hypothetical protein